MKKSLFTAKKTLALALSTLCVSTAFLGTACKPGGGGGNSGDGDIQVDNTKTQLYVANLQGGIGYEWLDKVITRFEALYENEVFKPGTQGVQIIPNKEYSVNGAWLLLPQDDPWEVYFNENLTYNEYVMQDHLLDLSDVVNAPAKTGPNSQESVTIASKLDDDQKAGLTAYDGNYYAIPHYEAYRGVSYNVKVFEEKKYFFAANKNNGNNGFILSKTDTRSAGPNGKTGDYDDGLPATLEEFAKLCERMAGTGTIPFVWPGESVEYTEYLVDAIEASIGGAEALELNYTYDSGEDGQGNPKTTKVITAIDGNNVTTQDVSIKNDNGYYVKQLLGKYYGYQTLEMVIDNIDRYAYGLSNNDDTFTQYDSQEDFIRSNLINKPIGMIIDGSYWWNEAKDAWGRAVDDFGETRMNDNKNFAWMPMPTAINESDRASGAKEPVLRDVMKSYAFVNANISDTDYKVRLAKEFVSFCYSDESLREFTTTTGVAKGLNYNLLPEEKEALNPFAKSCWTVREKGTIVRTLSSNRMVIECERNLLFNVFDTVVSGDPYSTPFRAFLDGISAGDYMKGQWILPNDWASDYGRYFTEGV